MQAVALQRTRLDTPPDAKREIQNVPMTDITVIIPTRNRRALLARTLHAVLTQLEVNLAVIVVDDGSADGTEAMVRSIGDPRVTLVRHGASRGVSAARNTGIEMATSPWLAFLDDDDLWAPTKLRLQLDALSSDSGARWSCTGAVGIDTDCNVLWWSEPPNALHVENLLLNLNVIPGGGSGVVAARDLTSQVGGFDEALSNLADWDFYIRLGLSSPPAVVPLPLVGYHIHPGGMSNNVQLSAAEYGYLAVKYARERESRGVELQGEKWLLHLAGMAFSGRKPWTGTRLHLALLMKHHRWRSIGSIGVGLAPRGLREVRARWLQPSAPPGWIQETSSWLPRYAQGSWDQALDN